MFATDALSTIDPIHGLQHHASTSATITMSRLHQGVPLYDRVKMLEIRGETVLMQAQNCLVMADCEGIVHLHSPELPYPIRARIIEVDLPRSLILLGEMNFLFETWHERKQIRVQPDAPVYFNLHKTGCLLRANLIDLDAGGVGATTAPRILDLLASGDDQSILMDINLAADLPLRNLRGTVCYARDLGPRAVRLGIRTHPTQDQTSQLNRYIEDRRGQIMDELLQAVNHHIGPAPVQDLYF